MGGPGQLHRLVRTTDSSRTVCDRRGQATPRSAPMILRATIPPRPAVDNESCCVEPDCNWTGETTGSVIEMDTARFAGELRALLDRELENARRGRDRDGSDRVARTPRFRNQAVLTLWLDQQIEGGTEKVELTDFPCVAEYPDHWNDLVFMSPTGLSHGRWLTCLTSAWCPLCGISYSASDLREIEHDLFFHGEYVLTCPRHHHLIIVRSMGYLLGG
jgi:hypothetical protein